VNAVLPHGRRVHVFVVMRRLAAAGRCAMREGRTSSLRQPTPCSGRSAPAELIAPAAACGHYRRRARADVRSRVLSQEHRTRGLCRAQVRCCWRMRPAAPDPLELKLQVQPQLAIAELGGNGKLRAAINFRAKPRSSQPQRERRGARLVSVDYRAEEHAASACRRNWCCSTPQATSSMRSRTKQVDLAFVAIRPGAPRRHWTTPRPT